MTHDPELVELFEYKVADLQRGREPRGGKRALAELRDYLLGCSLDVALNKRVRAADRLLKAAQSGKAGNAGRHLDGKPLGSGAHEGEALHGEQAGALVELSLGELGVGGSPLGALGEMSGPLKDQLSSLNAAQSGPDNAANTRNEWDVLSGLRAGLFHAELRSRAQQQARVWLKEPRLATLRLAYALTENLERGASGTAVPPLRDPFSSLHNPEIAAEVLSRLAEHLSVQVGELSKRYLQVRLALTQLADTPFPRTAAGDLVDANVQAAEQELLSEEVKKALIAALKRGPDAPRSATERPPIRSAASRLLTFLETVIPRSSGGLGLEWPLLDGLLYSQSATLRLTEPDPLALSLAIHLPGGQQTTWRGQSISWTPFSLGTSVAGHSERQSGWEIRLSDETDAHSGPAQAHATTQGAANIVRLSAQRPEVDSHFSGQPVRLVLIGKDLALELRPVTHSDLYLLSVEARLTAALLEPGTAYAHLRLARASAQRLRGNPISGEKVSAESASRYAAAPPETLLAFARQGAQTLLAYAAQGDDEALSRAFAEARTFLQLSRAHSEALLDLVRLSLQLHSLPIIGQADMSSVPEVNGDEYALLVFRGEPLTVKVKGRSVTLRNDYKGDLSAVMPGLSASAVRDLLVLPVPQGAITLIRAGERVAVGFQPILVEAL
ncbi:hypothetical protein EHF33_12135 [Deinococcus psychrotolerans]|uniref:Uncharacterized protein n=1 Tax=Deinococcus psychrotolerans TaxID=2489213 RepID=A0A3G8YP54_9DEIO|nr:hypothetical protein [Deinococcus psychrotolerans]AZI43401.1 hypothetical protein EHF33_12135 [Deinococcus psychrotolerans]